MFNVLSHGSGFVLSSLGLIHIWENHGHALNLWQWCVLLLYAGSWIGLYACSTLYHASRHLQRKAFLRVLDHCAIFIVIAASYGPFVLFAINDRTGRILLSISWMIALLGCVFKFTSVYRYHVQSTWAYMFQGWLVFFNLRTLLANISTAGFLSMMVGGVFMTVGTYFYIRDDVKYNHGAWHICVILGGLGFFLAILELLPT